MECEIGGTCSGLNSGKCEKCILCGLLLVTGVAYVCRTTTLRTVLGTGCDSVDISSCSHEQGNNFPVTKKVVVHFLD